MPLVADLSAAGVVSGVVERLQLLRDAFQVGREGECGGQLERPFGSDLADPHRAVAGANEYGVVAAPQDRAGVAWQGRSRMGVEHPHWQVAQCRACTGRSVGGSDPAQDLVGGVGPRELAV